jgi:hypothetical protein
MTRRGAALAAAWTSPALLAVLVSCVASGQPAAPLLALLTVAAPLVALVRPRAPAASNPLTRAAALVVIAGLVWANVIVFADVASMLGGARWQGAVLAATLALLVTVRPAAGAMRAVAPVAGIACVLVAAAAAAAVSGQTPWSAWTEVAARSAFVFPEHGADTRFGADTTLQFTEVHRVVALTDAAFRVTEVEGAATVVREWSVRENDVLMLRPGDRLSVPAGVRVRFEAGKRVPGSPASGAQWADAPGRRGVRALPAALGLALTLLGGAAALVPSWPRAHGRSSTVVPLVFGCAAVCCGIYAAALAPAVTLERASPGALVGLARALPGAAAAAVTAVICAGLLALLIAAAQTLRPRVMAIAGAPAPAMWTATFAVAAVGGMWPVDGGLVLWAALGFAASAWVAPLLGAGADDGKMWSAAAVGSIAGALVFGALTALAGRLPEWAGSLGDYPALLAAPAAWGVAFRARRPSARRGGGTGRSLSATSGP